jgi:hypothetical protein
MDTNMVHRFFGRVSSTVDEGADAVMQLAFAEETSGITGAYFDQLTEARGNAQAYDEEARKKLWQASEALTKAYLK